MSGPPRKTLMRNLGEFVGHVLKGIRSDTEHRKVVRRSVEEREEGPVVLRRTTIEEIEVKKEEQ